jgi:mitogen-activated protein kinase organizer 1
MPPHPSLTDLQGSEDGKIFFWDMVKGSQVCPAIQAHNRAVSSLSYHPKDPLFLSASYDGSIHVWQDR